MPLARIELLSPTTSSEQGSHSTLPRRLCELLAFLVMRRRPVTRAELAACVWPDLDGEASANVFYVTMHRLRRRFPSGTVARTRSGYALGAAATVDIVELEALAAEIRGFRLLTAAEATAVETGYARLVAAAPFVLLNEALAPLDDRCRHVAAELAERLAAHRLRSGEPEAALSLATSMLDVDPCDEAGWEIVIRSHLSSSRRSDALRAFRRYTVALDRELGLPPSEHLQRLIGAAMTAPL